MILKSVASLYQVLYKNFVISNIMYIYFLNNLYFFRDELFMPENTYNPEKQYVYHCIAQKAINNDKLLTKTIPENIQNMLYPPKTIREKAKEPINELKKKFSLISKNNEKYE